MTRAFDATGTLSKGVTLLEASAGTGKTYGITSLVLRLVVEEELRLDQILVVTFTEPATAELRDRVRRRMREAIAALEGDAGASDKLPEDEVLAHLVRRARSGASHQGDARRLRGELERFDQAAISTIHGFCARVLREHAFECHADADAQLLVDPRPLLDEIVQDYWAREIATRPASAVAPLLECGLSIASLRTLAAEATADPEVPLVPDAPTPSEWEAIERTHQGLCAELAAAWRTHGGSVRALVRERLDAKVLNANVYRGTSLDRWFAELDRWAHAPVGDRPGDVLQRFTTNRIATATRKGQTSPAHPFFEECERLESELDRLGIERMIAFRREMTVLRRSLVDYVRTEFRQRKEARRLHTYDDLLHLVRAALRRDGENGALRIALRDRFQAALIDEFQDTDGTQWEIFRQLFGGGDRWLVLIGDPKQAIYSFRGADIHAYLDAKHSATEVLSLATNRRSDAPLVAAVNHLYISADRPFAIEGVDYQRVEAHHRTARLTGLGEVPFVVRVVDGKGDAFYRHELRDQVATFVADDVVRTLDAGAQIEDRQLGWRPLAPRDLAVLVRKHDQALLIQRALRRAAVPSVIYGAKSVFESDEAGQLESLLAALVEPSSVRQLRAALATELIGLAAAAELGIDGGPGDAIARIDIDPELTSGWLERVHAWSALWEQRGIMPALRAILDELHLPERLLALEDGERRLTNLRHVAELLHLTAVSEALEPPALLHWLRTQREERDRSVEAHQMRLESDDDAVQILTTHRAKGLEYPIVWCPFLWEGRSERELASFHFHDGRTRCLDIGEHEGRSGNLARTRADAYAEELRLMYVALTRARHRCIVHWGAERDGDTSPLARLLFGAGEDTDGARRIEGATDGELREAIALLAESSGRRVMMQRESEPAALRWKRHRDAGVRLDARRWTRATSLDRSWRMGSFTALTRTHGTAHDEEAHEAIDDARGGTTATAVHLEAIPLDRFPSSARAGIFFHDILERFDPAHEEALEALVRERMPAYGFDAGEWGATVTASLRSVMTTSLLATTPTLTLASIPLADRLTELRFEFPVHGGLAATAGVLTPATLARAFASHQGGATPSDYAQRLARLDFPALRGFLTGAIDLVARHQGRWFIVDYKSNRLGPHAASYAPEAMSEELAGAHYHLQYHFYLVALHRYLRWRLPDYDYERDVGGVFYLFLRGMARERGSSTGVFHDRPPLARIEALERALGMVEVAS